MGILEGIWTFLNTPVGQTIVVSVLGWFGVKVFKKKSRWESITEIAADLWTIVESQGTKSGWSGNEKWEKFVSYLISRMREAGMGMPSGKEMAALKEFANRKAELDKAQRQLMGIASKYLPDYLGGKKEQ